MRTIDEIAQVAAETLIERGCIPSHEMAAIIAAVLRVVVDPFHAQLAYWVGIAQAVASEVSDREFRRILKEARRTAYPLITAYKETTP